MKDLSTNNELKYITILYYLTLCEKGLHDASVANTNFSPISEEINYLYFNNYIEIKNQQYVIATKGAEIIKQVCGFLDNVGKFQIFSNVVIDMVLPSNLKKDDIHVLDYVHDPRFVADEGEDLRISMMEYFHQSCTRAGQSLPSVNFIKVIYLQNLYYSSNYVFDYTFWFDLKLDKYFNEAMEIYANGFHLQDFDEDYEKAFSTASEIYKAGILEDIKRYGRRCSKCDSPVGVFDSKAEVLECPNPHCNSNNILEGSVAYSEEDYYLYETYGYEPYVFYNPYNPCVDSLAFGFLCGAILL